MVAMLPILGKTWMHEICLGIKARLVSNVDNPV